MMMEIHNVLLLLLRLPLTKCLPTTLLFLQLLLHSCIIGTNTQFTGGLGGGRWQLLLNNTGVVAMHMALTHRNTVVIFDQTQSGPSAYRLHSSSSCSNNDNNNNEDDDNTNCWAHSVEYDIATNIVRPLTLRTDTWCSSGLFLSNGTLAQTGGHGNGIRKIRYFEPCSDRQCDWTESKISLADDRWYATNQILPEKDRAIIVGGLRVFSYEFIPKSPLFPNQEQGGIAFDFPFLQETRNEREDGDNLYPFVHLSSDGNLFIFANRDSILFNYHTQQVIKRFPKMPGDGARNYPSTGSSVMLPLDHADRFTKVEIMVCGGGAPGTYRAARDGEFLEALSSCGRMVITEDNPNWEMEDMPGPRLMNDMIILPTGDILIINGATHGCAGWNRATGPAYSPYLYKPNMNRAQGSRFSTLKPSNIARMYHSSALLLPDGRVLVAGSNPYRRYTLSGVEYPTELRMEAYVPYYMDSSFDHKRARIIFIGFANGIKYGQHFNVQFKLDDDDDEVEFHVYAPPFATHSLSMNQRMLKLESIKIGRGVRGLMFAVVVGPPSPVVAPSGYYMFTVVNGGIPSESQWVRFVDE